MKATVVMPPFETKEDRERREKEQQRRSERAESAAEKVREKLGDGAVGKAVSWLTKAMLKMDPPGPTH